MMSSSADRPLDYIAAGGLLVGAVFGLAGTFVASPDAPGQPVGDRQRCLGGGDQSAGPEILPSRSRHTSPPAFWSLRSARACCCRERPPDPRPVCRPSPRGRRSGPRRSPSSVHRRQLPWWVRALGGVGACMFAITAGRIYAGEALLPTSSPLPFFAYPFLVATLLGWAWVLLWGVQVEADHEH